jgi:hypothetical protein
MIFDVNNAGWLRATKVKLSQRASTEDESKEEWRRGKKGRLHLLCERDVDRILSIVFTGDEELSG